MRLTVVGCSGSVPGPDSAASSYVVSADGFQLVLDLGSGAFGPLQQHVGIADIGAIALSHLHADHCLDLCGLYVAAKYAPGGPLPHKIPVYGPPGSAERMARAYDLPQESGMTGEMEFTLWQPEQRIGPFTVRTVQVRHPVIAYAIRIEHDGRSLVYSGDTGPCDHLVELAADTDVLLCEAAMHDADPDNPPDLHLTGAQAGEHAAKARAGRLVVTHVPPWYDRDEQARLARTTFDGEVSAAVPGAVYEI